MKEKISPKTEQKSLIQESGHAKEKLITADINEFLDAYKM